MSDKSNSFTNGVLIGTLVGFAIGTLLIPPQGKENRKKLKKAKAKADEKYEEYKPAIQEAERKLKPIETKVADQITHLADVSLESIEKRMRKSNKNATKRNFFKASF